MLSLYASAYYQAINLQSYYCLFYWKQIFLSSENYVKAWSSLAKFHAKGTIIFGKELSLKLQAYAAILCNFTPK